MSRERNSEWNAVIKRISKNIWEANNVAERCGCWADQTGSPWKKCMLEFLISQRWQTHQELITMEQFCLILFFCVPLKDHRLWYHQRKFGIMSFAWWYRKRDLLIAVIVGWIIVVSPNHSFIPTIWCIWWPSEHLSPNNETAPDLSSTHSAVTLSRQAPFHWHLFFVPLQGRL